MEFIQNQIFKMNWLYLLVENFLKTIGLDTDTKIFTSIHFFIYDTIKISILLVTLIFLISYIQSYFPPERTRKILKNFRGIKGNILGALLGTVTPFCSCSSIPIFMGFTQAGVPINVSFSFLISSPMVDLGSLALLTSIFGVKIAIVYVLLGLVIAVVGGILIERLKMEKYVEGFVINLKNKKIDKDSADAKIDRINFSIDQVKFTFKKVFPYILIGVLIGSIIHNWIPERFVEKILGSSNPFGVILATIIGVPMYGDIFGAIPIAEALLYKKAQLGVVLSFMMAITTLSLPSMIMLKKVLKPKLLITFIFICSLGIIIVGYVFNLIQFIL